MDLVMARRFTRKLPNLISDRDYFPFAGGLNLVDTALTVKPGQLLAAKNYECAMRGGYERIEGFERYDGRPKPSEASYWILDFVNGVPANYPAVGDVVTGVNSTATGTLAVEMGTATTGRLVFRAITGEFAEGEPLQANGLSFANGVGIALRNDAENDDLDYQYKAVVRNYARAQIGPVPGEGAIRGVAVYRGVAYAIRNNVGSTAAVMHKESASGWVPVSMGRRLGFDTGLDEIPPGTTVTGSLSGATGVVRRIVIRSGDWLTHNSAGYLILSDVTGAFQNDDVVTGGGGSVTATGADTAQALPANGRYEFRVHNFYGQDGSLRLYGVNGVGYAIEYQDSPEFLCLIETGMPVDQPTHLAVHRNQLWLSFRGGSLQKSGTGEPSNWLALSNAFELAVGDNCVGLLEEVGGSLFVFSRNSTRVIAGNEADGYQMDTFSIDTGAREWSIQRLGQGFYLDDLGFTSLAAAQDFGNFSANNVSVLIDPLVQELRDSLVMSVVARRKNRIRYFFADGRIISAGFIGKQIAGFTTCDYGLNFQCAFSGEDPTGDELLLMGGENGYVYQGDSGTSFDGESVQAFFRTVFYHSGSPSRIKRYRMAHVDIVTRGPMSLRATVDYSFANPESAGEPVKDLTMRGGGGFWDVSRWNEFRWSASAVSQATFKLEGSGYNIGLLFSSDSADELPHILNGVTFHVSGRRLNRST